VDAIVHVLRDFADTNIVREGSTDPVSDRDTIETELALADMQVMEKLIAAQDKAARSTGADAIEKQKLEILQSIQKELEAGHMLSRYTINDIRLTDWFKSLPLLAIKPILYVYNVSEDSYQDRLAQGMTNPNEMIVSAKLEEELVELSDEERIEYLNELGIKETGLERLIKKAYEMLGLASFLTAGKKEVKAWTIKQGMKAPEAAGVIHTDFTKKFIRAEVIEFEKLVEAGNRGVAKTRGWVRTEGKEYVVKDGDIIEFLIGS
jgi:GTP-binding protein YchF